MIRKVPTDNGAVDSEAAQTAYGALSFEVCTPITGASLYGGFIVSPHLSPRHIEKLIELLRNKSH